LCVNLGRSPIKLRHRTVFPMHSRRNSRHGDDVYFSFCDQRPIFVRS
jgi:hypothetical protein